MRGVQALVLQSNPNQDNHVAGWLGTSQRTALCSFWRWAEQGCPAWVGMQGTPSEQAAAYLLSAPGTGAIS